MRRIVSLLPILLVLAATAKAGDLPASTLDGEYDGVFAAPSAPGCGFNTPLNEHMTFTVTTKEEAVRINWKSPFGNSFEFTATLVRDGEGWALDGRYTATNVLGTGTFTGRLIALAHGVIFTQHVRSATHPDCISDGTMVGARPF
jgi:hypothetical protein